MTDARDRQAPGLARLIRPFDAVVSPYHLTSREPAALIALQLAASATTLLFAPTRSGESAESVRAEATRSPVYGAYMRSWEWAMPLFGEGVLGTTDEGEDPVEDVRAACGQLHRDATCAPLRPYLREDLFEDETLYLRAASADVLKAGPDPGVSIPIAAGLDAFAAARGMIVIRSGTASVVQRAERSLAREIFRVSVPAVVRGSAERVLLVRALLDDARAVLGREIAYAFESGKADRVRAAANAYAQAFEAERADITMPPGPADDDEVRLVLSEASLAGVELPLDAVFRSSVLAATGRDLWSGSGSGVVRALVVRSVGGS